MNDGPRVFLGGAFRDCHWATYHKSASTARGYDFLAFSAFHIVLTIRVSTILPIASCLSILILIFQIIVCAARVFVFSAISFV
jgi:hypothetical protein